MLKVWKQMPINIFSIIFVCSCLFGVDHVCAQGIIERLNGQILLQVEENGEAWYLYPETQTRFFMGRPHDAFNLMRDLGLGINTETLDKIPIGLISQSGQDTDNDGLVDLLEQAIGSDIYKNDSDNDGYHDREEVENGYSPIGPEKKTVDQSLVERLKGRILIQVESRGEAWYVFPENGKRYFLGRPNDAFGIMRNLGLGITNEDIKKITIDENSAES